MSEAGTKKAKEILKSKFGASKMGKPFKIDLSKKKVGSKKIE